MAANVPSLNTAKADGLKLNRTSSKRIRPYSEHRRTVLERLDLDGFREFSKSKRRLSKIIWSTIILIYYAMAIRQTILTIWQFHIGKTIVSVEDLPSTYPHKGFPQVHLCFTGNWNKTYITENIEIPSAILEQGENMGLGREDLLDAFSNYISYYTPNFDYPISDQLWSLLTEVFQHNFRNVEFTDYLTDAALQGSKIFSKCWYSGKDYQCFPFILIQDMPSCYALMTPNFHLNQHNFLALGDGISEKLDISTGDNTMLQFHVTVPNRDLFNPDDPQDTGLRLILGIPSPLAIQYAIPGNSHTIMNFDQSTVELISNCSLSTENLSHGQSIYSYHLCLVYTLNEEVFNVCRCSMIFQGSMPKNGEVCTPELMKKCVQPKVFYPLFQPGDNRKLIVKSRCPRQCSEVRHTAFVTFHDLEGPNDTIKSIITIRPNLERRTQSEEAYMSSIYAVFSEVGSVIGVWTGLSVAAAARVIGILTLASAKEINSRVVKPILSSLINIPMATLENDTTRKVKGKMKIIHVKRTIRVAAIHDEHEFHVDL